jgi:hypothetical protein
MYPPLHIIIRVLKSITKYARERCVMHTIFQSDNLKERDQLEELEVDGTIRLKCILKKCDDSEEVVF